MSPRKRSSKDEPVPEKAKQQIAENKRTRDRSLVLSGCGLTKVPAEVGELVWLEALDLSDNKGLADLTPLAGLTALQTLEVHSSKVSDLKPLARLSALQLVNLHDTEVTDLSPLAGLSGLEELYSGGRSVLVRDLKPLARLTALRRVDVSDTQLSDLSPLAGLSRLEMLRIPGTKVTDLTPLAGLAALRTLWAHNTRITDVSPLAGLSALQNLSLWGAQVSDLSPLIPLIRSGCQVKWERFADKGILVENCPLTNPPPEVVKQGNEAILNYFAEREAGGVDHLYEAKMLILGEGGAGKTSLLGRLYQPGQPLPKESDTTRGIAISKQEFKTKDGHPFRLNVWDFGGQQIYHATHQFFLTRRSLYVLLDDTRKDYKSVSDEYFRYWLELIEVFGGHSPTLIFQNEKDGRSKAIDIGGIRQRYDNVKELYAGDLAKDDAVEKVRDGIEFYASQLKHIGDEVPARWLKVRSDIEQLAGKEAHVPVEKYFEIYRKHIELDEKKALQLSQYLHDLGVFLHFQDDPLLARTVILQNEWATEAVFRVLDDETVKKALGRFTHEDCARLWNDPAHARMHPELLALMQNFELCYKLPDSKAAAWLVPQLLPPAKPKELADWSKPEDLVLRYKYDFLPNGMISRLTVRMHRFVRDPQMAWVTGVLFERGSTAVLAQILQKGDEIELRARGPEAKALLSVIAADLDALNDSFQGLKDKVDKRIPCNCKNCRAASEPGFFDEKALLERKEDNRLELECPRPRSYEKVNVLELLDGMKLDTLPGWAKEAPEAPSRTSADVAPREISIFVASSAEFSEDRKDFELYFRRLNDEARKQGFYLKIVLWENFLDAVSETRLQDEYNKAICDCDIFVSLFFTRTGKFTEEEFDVALGEFKRKGSPRIFTFFKDAPVSIHSLREEDFKSLRAFQAKLKELGHYPTVYTNTDDLKLRFRDQLDKLLKHPENGFSRG